MSEAELRNTNEPSDTMRERYSDWVRLVSEVVTGSGAGYRVAPEVYTSTTPSISVIDLTRDYDSSGEKVLDDWGKMYTPVGIVSREEHDEPADKLVQIRNLISRGQIKDARERVVEALLRWPMDESLLKMQELIAPAKIARTKQQYRERHLEVSWINRNRDKYRGKWVALIGEEPVAVADDLKTLLASLRARDHKEMPLIHRID